MEFNTRKLIAGMKMSVDRKIEGPRVRRIGSKRGRRTTLHSWRMEFQRMSP
jgi:hypothetical protein